MISNLKLTRTDAALVATSIQFMPGTEEYLNRRNAIAERMKKTWPEIIGKGPATETFDATEARDFALDEFDKRALGEGLRGVLKLDNSNGGDFVNCLAVAKACKIEKWFRDVVAKKPIPAFEGESDDEVSLGDDEDESAAAK